MNENRECESPQFSLGFFEFDYDEVLKDPEFLALTYYTRSLNLICIIPTQTPFICPTFSFEMKYWDTKAMERKWQKVRNDAFHAGYNSDWIRKEWDISTKRDRERYWESFHWRAIEGQMRFFTWGVKALVGFKHNVLFAFVLATVKTNRQGDSHSLVETVRCQTTLYISIFRTSKVQCTTCKLVVHLGLSKVQRVVKCKFLREIVKEQRIFSRK